MFIYIVMGNFSTRGVIFSDILIFRYIRKELDFHDQECIRKKKKKENQNIFSPNAFIHHYITTTSCFRITYSMYYKGILEIRSQVSEIGLKGGARGATVIVMGNKPRELSSNHGQ